MATIGSSMLTTVAGSIKITGEENDDGRRSFMNITEKSSSPTVTATDSTSEGIKKSETRLIRRLRRVDVGGERPTPLSKEPAFLIANLNKEQIQAICEVFKERLVLDPLRPRKIGSEFDQSTLNRDDFKKMVRSVAGVTLTEDDFDVIFLKIDTNRSGSVTWDEVISHLMLELKELEGVGMGMAPADGQAGLAELTDPISALPERIKSHHRHNIIRVTFCPVVEADRAINYLHGKFVTASKDGMIQFWSMDMSRDRTVYSQCVLLKVRPTWVTDLVCLPDVNIVCTSSTERELRFYDTTANKWELRVLISAMNTAVVCMHYHMSSNPTDESALLLGDMNGEITVFLFPTVRRGPFRPTIGQQVNHVLYKDLVKSPNRWLPGLRIVDFPRVHSDWVRQVSYYASLQSFISCAACSTTSMYMCDAHGTKNQYKYDVRNGIYCFAFLEETHLIVTGGPDCIVRVWNPFVCSRPSSLLLGHHSAIVAVVIQRSGRRVASLDAERIVRVWDVPTQTCTQTYNGLVGSPRMPITTYYHPLTKVWIIASRDMDLIRVSPKLNPDRTDGFTHTDAVTCVLYNSLFKCVVTTGLDSSIMVWDPWQGSRTLFIKVAHSRMHFGQEEPIEITAATFDPPQQLLLTGASNGSLRIWNFHTGICVRNMTIGLNKEVTAVAWVPTRILAVGWTGHVTEWADSGASLHGKAWESRHSGHILCADSRPPDALVTGSDYGELVFWRLETAQPYAKFSVAEPTHKSGMSHYVEEEVSFPPYWMPVHMPKITGADSLPPRIHAVRFLQTRPVSRGVGSLCVSLSTGFVQIWSHHPVGGYLSNFLAVHTITDYVTCMATDPECNYLFTGHSLGYIKIWLMSTYCYPGGPIPVISKAALRKTFPFLYADRILGRAKRAVRNQSNPMLLSSCRGHLQGILHLDFMAENKLLLSASADHSVRVWSLGGEYIALLGSFLPWPKLSPGTEWDSSNRDLRIPADLKRVSSSTTLKVLHRGHVSSSAAGSLVDQKPMLSIRPISLEDLLRATYGQRAYKPILGHCFKLADRALGSLPTVILDKSYPKIPVYRHIRLHMEQVIERPPTPESVVAIRTLKLDPRISHLTAGSSERPDTFLSQKKSSIFIPHSSLAE